jgi:hypothetical protein
VLKGLGIAVGTLLVVGLGAAIVLYAKGASQLTRTYSVPTDRVESPTDEVALARGKELV